MLHSRRLTIPLPAYSAKWRSRHGLLPTLIAHYPNPNAQRLIPNTQFPTACLPYPPSGGVGMAYCLLINRDFLFDDFINKFEDYVYYF